MNLTPPATVDQTTDLALELKAVRKQFGKTEIIRGIDLQVRQGERVAVIGPNGAGKSTLFNLISGRFALSSGEIWLREHRIDGKTPYQINRLGLSRSFQITNIFPKLSVFENLRCAVLWSLGYRYTFWKFLANLNDANDRTEALLESIRLDKRRDVLAVNLTYAEQRALDVAPVGKLLDDGRKVGVLGLREFVSVELAGRRGLQLFGEFLLGRLPCLGRFAGLVGQRLEAGEQQHGRVRVQREVLAAREQAPTAVEEALPADIAILVAAVFAVFLRDSRSPVAHMATRTSSTPPMSRVT